MSEAKKHVNEEQGVVLTTDALKEIIATAIAAAKAPNVIEQAEIAKQQKTIEQDNQTRLEASAQIKKKMEGDVFRKRTCQLVGGKPKHPHTVFVSDDIGGYVLCQMCRAVIRPEGQLVHFPKDIQKTRLDIIFDTQLFNKVFQNTDASGVFA
jgi:hypothetical protein